MHFSYNNIHCKWSKNEWVQTWVGQYILQETDNGGISSISQKICGNNKYPENICIKDITNAGHNISNIPVGMILRYNCKSYGTTDYACNCKSGQRYFN